MGGGGGGGGVANFTSNVAPSVTLGGKDYGLKATINAPTDPLGHPSTL
jgi:hypothetical protein